MAYKPWLTTMKLKAAAIMTNAMSMMAVSKPTIPRFWWTNFMSCAFTELRIFWLHDGQLTMCKLDRVCHS